MFLNLINVIIANHFVRPVISCMIPTRREKNISQFIVKTRSLDNIFEERDKLSKIDIDKIARIDFSCNAVLNIYVFLLLLISFKYSIPNVE